MTSTTAAFKNISTDLLEECAYRLRLAYHRVKSERVWSKYLQVRTALDARHMARLARLQAA
jgi:hypothetical protein